MPKKRVQPKLLVGAADDPLEREADRVADDVMRTLHSRVAVDAAVFGDESADTSRIRRSTTPRASAGAHTMSLPSGERIVRRIPLE